MKQFSLIDNHYQKKKNNLSHLKSHILQVEIFSNKEKQNK